MMAWRRSGDKPLSEPCWLIYWTIYTRPQWVNVAGILPPDPTKLQIYDKYMKYAQFSNRSEIWQQHCCHVACDFYEPIWQFQYPILFFRGWEYIEKTSVFQCESYFCSDCRGDGERAWWTHGTLWDRVCKLCWQIWLWSHHEGSGKKPQRFHQWTWQPSRIPPIQVTWFDLRKWASFIHWFQVT